MMLRVAFVVPYPEMEPLIRETWALHCEAYKDTKLEEGYEFSYFVDTGVSPKNITGRQYDVDVIVSRGGTALGLKEMNFYTPIVEIPLTSNDVRASIDIAIARYGNLPIGVVGTNNMVYAVEHMMNTEDYDIKVYRVESVERDTLIHGVNRAIKGGCKIVIGGINTVKYCADNNIKSQMLVSSREAIWESITEAKRCAILTNAERRRSVLFEAILDQTFEGMIAVDNDGRIQSINAAATRMLGLSEAGHIAGQKLDKVLPQGRLIYILKSRNVFSNEIIHYGNNQFVLNSVPMQLAGAPIGTVATFQNANIIVEAESRIRDKIYARGHVARYHFEDILGQSEAIVESKNRARQFAAVDSNIMLFGETGTGKELFAQSVHNASARKNGPFVAVNCAALPDNLMESEFFGYVAGAFTGASKGGKAGLFELAHHGTIFLDEISEIPPVLQSRLLRVIQEREIMRLGHDRVIPIDVRIICASNQDLFALVKKGAFREDLYYRLNVLSITLPPLRDRDADALMMMRAFLNEYAAKFAKNEIELTDGALELAKQCRWNGNIRQLRNICEQLAVLNTTGVIDEADMRAALPKTDVTPNAGADAPTISHAPLEIDMLKLERARVAAALSAAKTRDEAARMLKMGRTTLWRKMKEYGLA